ncbi:MAG: hypothetical protein HY913_15660 [Desulfomonile tiedjei]|nr:hypothetical protein [Desulfomonile tiedjei]
MKMILRQALDKDRQAIESILKPWTDDDPEVLDALQDAFRADLPGAIRCRLLETDKTIRCVSVWKWENKDEVRLIALGMGPGASEFGIDNRFISEEILDWADSGVSKVTVVLPEMVAPPLTGSLRTSGFIFEGISSSCGVKQNSRVRFCKHFLYRSIPYSQVMGFIKDFLLSLGYEVRTEGDGLGYRIRSDHRFPFIFNAWHRITRSGPDIIVHPPARVLELYDLETIFYPLTIRTRNEKPLLIPMDKKRASHLLNLPRLDAHQGTLFAEGAGDGHRQLFSNNLTYSYPAGLQGMRRGMPLLFYVNRVGAVGTGRLDDWYLDEPKNLYNNLDEMGYFDPQDVKEHVASSGPNAGKVMVIRFKWYRSLKRVVSLEEIRGIDDGFNPQRTRSLSSQFFQSVVAAGNRV